MEEAQSRLDHALEDFLDKMPRVFDPFAGGGAIPLEAARLGCRSYGNDINPVAHIIQKGSLEFPQKYGKPIVYGKEEFIGRYSQAAWDEQPIENKIYKNGEAQAIRLENRLSFDVDFFARELLRRTEKEIGHYYPADENGNKPIAYYWARIGKCTNPSCSAEVPLLKGFYLCNKPEKQVYLEPEINGANINFSIKYGKTDLKGWISRGNLECPCCGNTTDVKQLKAQFINKATKVKMLAVIWDSPNGKKYSQPKEPDLQAFEDIPENQFKPTEPMPTKYTQALPSCTWGLSIWGDMFTQRQLLALNTLVQKLNELKLELHAADSDYGKALVTYLGILLDRVSIVNTSFGRWHISGEKIEHPFARQAIPMVFDFPESNLFSGLTGSVNNQISWVIRYLESEGRNSFSSACKNASSGDKTQFEDKYITSVITDPPYYDAIAYADLSDFFYVWLKRTVGDIWPLNFATPQTPKSDECTALKHHQNGSAKLAKKHFEDKLLQIFDAIEHQTSDIVSIMFAHQSTEAWTTLCNSILGARMNITGSWAIDTEMSNRSIGLAGAALASSVTVSCRPAQRQGIGDFKTVKKAIEERVQKEVDHLYELGFRGADLLTACFGQAVSEFGKYQSVEKADGSQVTVGDLLEMARESALNALLKGFNGDDFTKFYIAWLQLYGFAESEFDDAAKLSRVGLSINVQELFQQHILLKNGSKQALGTFENRIKEDKKLGENQSASLIDQVHRAMFLYKGTNRGELLQYLAGFASEPSSVFWRVLTSLCELLPTGSEDMKQAQGLLVNKDNLLRESQQLDKDNPIQTTLDF